MTEEFVTLETAKLLKEKGFKEDVFTFYKAECAEGDLELFESYEVENFNARTDNFSAPTQSIAQKWLREKRNLHIEIFYSYDRYWYYDIIAIPNHYLVGLIDRPIIRYGTYKEALEDGIKECLKLI